jgi:DNA invertase Pin-like site-specific DNA recombinase
MILGYCRVSTQFQSLDSQLDALKKYGCEDIYQEKQSAIKNRPELAKLIEHIRQGDKIVVVKLDRLGRSLRDLIQLTEIFKEKGVEFVSIRDNVDTSTAQGRLFFNIMGSLAEFERELISERTQIGLAAARARGRSGGRPPGLNAASVIKSSAAINMYRNGESISNILNTIKIGSKATLYKYLKLDPELKARIESL